MQHRILFSLFLWLGLTVSSFGQHSHIHRAEVHHTSNKLSEYLPALYPVASKGELVPGKRNCGTTEYMESMLSADPAWKIRLEDYERDIEQFSLNRNSMRTQAVITIPVVVHVVYRTATENISDAQIMSQIAILNNDCRKLNADTNLIPPAFRPLAADVQIEFCMAVQDPNGNPTNGITRTQTTVTSFSTNNAVKSNSSGGKSAWNTSKYLNIWVCNMGGGILGYAQFPGGSASTDGVVVGHRYFGNIGTAQAPYNKGRTLTHEVGHWLNLRHIWGDSNCGNDFVSDTPTSQAANYGCPSFPKVTCSNGPNGDMFMNYMDYVDDACMQMFTPGQGTRMLAALNGPRASLLTSDGCVPLNAPPSTNFVASSTIILAGASVNFTDLSLYNPTSWSWTFTGGTPATSTQQNPSNIVYSTPGAYTVTLTATNSNGSDTETKTMYINVVNPGGPGACDTVNFPLQSYFLYTVPNGGGFVTGTNGFNDEAKAVYISSAGAATHITGVMIDFGAATAATTSSSIQVNIWDNSGPSGSPGNVIGSQSLLITDIITNGNNGNASVVAFNNPVPITGPFYAGFTIPSTVGDTVAVVSDSVDTTMPGIAWERYQGAWYEMSDATNSFGLNLNLGIYPLTTNTLVSAGFNVVNPTVCIGDTVQLTGTSQNAQVYSWSFPGGTPTSSSLVNPQVSYLSQGSYTISLQAVGSCLATSTLTQTNVITVQPNPAVSLTPNGITICPGNSATLTASGATNYQWSPPNGLSALTGSTVTATPSASEVYTVTGTDNTGCSNTVTVNVDVVTNLIPTADFNINPTFGCPGATININNTSQDALNYTWNMPGGSPATSLQQNPVVTYTNPGSYGITLVAFGCNGNDTAVYNNVVTISAPIAIVSPSTDTILVGGSTTLTAIGGISYSWFPPTGLNTSTGSVVVASPVVTTTYTVTVTDNQGCQNTVDVEIVVLPVRNDALELEANWNVYPVPATSYLVVENVKGDLQSGKVSIWSIDGKLQQQVQLQGVRTEVPVSGIMPGVYILEVLQDEVSVMRKKVFISK
jgi:PKD repeat protein